MKIEKTTTTTTATTTDRTADLYTTAQKAVYIALRARHEKSGLLFLADLQNGLRADQTPRKAVEIADQIADLEKLHESHRKGYEFFNARATRLTLSDYERALAFTLAEDFKRKAENEQKRIADLYDLISTTYTDTADLVQIAVLQILENEKNPAPLTAQILATYGVDTAEELTAEELKTAQNTANFKAVINAVGRGISTLAHPEALNSTHTKAEKITDLNEVTDFMLKYGGIGNEYKAPHQTKRARASDCYITIEERHTKTQNGFYKIYHYKTIAPYQYIDTYTDDENGETDIAYLKTYDPFISNTADLDYLTDLTEKANLTDRQRLFLQEFARRCRFSADFQECKQYAFSKIGITTTTNQTTFFNRLKDRLKTATK